MAEIARPEGYEHGGPIDEPILLYGLMNTQIDAYQSEPESDAL